MRINRVANIATTAAAKINFFIWNPFKVALPIVYGGKGFGANSLEYSFYENNKGGAFNMLAALC